MHRDPLARVRACAATLPDVDEGTTFGYPAFKIGGKAFAWFPKKEDVESGSLGVRMSTLERDHRIAAGPNIFYLTPHYQDYDSVLARVELMSDAELRELLASGYEYMTVTKRANARGRRSV